jgi:putative ABC transport system permease protein
MGSLLQDLQYGLRSLTRSRGFATVAVLTFALGIGANTMIFSVIETVLLQPLPYEEPDRLVMVWETTLHSPGERDSVSLPNYLDWQLENHVFEDMALFDAIGKGYNLAGPSSDPEQVSGVRVSASLFPLLGAKPYLGRTFRLEEEIPGKDREVVLSYELWKRRYKGDPALVGKTVQVDGDDYTVVGVMPPEFQFQHRGGLRELWVPIGYTNGDQRRDSRSFNVCARLKPDVTVDQARDEMESLGQQLSHRYPQDNAGRGATVTPMSRLGAGERWQTLRTLLAAVGFVLLIACVNVANLMLARSAVRQRELGVRRALGAGQGRIARQLLTESLLLSLVGGAAGFVLVMWSTGFLIRILPFHIRTPPFHHFDTLRIDGRVLGFTLLVACLTGVLAGSAPAFSGIGRDLNRSLKAGGSLGATPGGPDGGARLRHALVASEVALALLVLAGAGLMIDSVARLLGVKPGLDPKNVLTMEMSLPQFNIYYGPPFHPLFCHDLDESIGTLPGVISVSSVSHLPLRGVPAERGFTIEGRPDPGAGNLAIANYAVACPNYFRTMRIPVLQGREFTDKDRLAASPVAIINASMARRFWPDQNPIGERFKLEGFSSAEPWFTVIGVVQDVRQGGLDGEIVPQFFRPYAQAAWPVMTVVVRTTSDPMSFAVLTKKALADIDPDQPVTNVRTMKQVLDDSLGPRRFPMLLLIAFSLLALVLAAIGIVGVASYSVAQRTHEIGIRMALGARRTDVLRLVVSRTMLWVAVGVGLGLIGSITLRRLLAGLLYGVSPTDPLVLGVVSTLLAAVALVASYIPARRAAKVDPLVALRWE